MNADVDLSAGLRVNGDRLAARLADLGEIGAIPGTDGCSRLALTDEDRAGRDLVLSWMRDLGLDVSIDGIGNAVAVIPHPDGGTWNERPVMTGSHIDTVATGGKYDGNLGVLAGLEVIETVMTELDNGCLILDRPLAVAWFSDEEGARFPPDMLGSLVYVGGMALEQALDITDRHGTTVGGELDRIGYRGTAPLPGPVPHSFVELHIEQGPILEDEEVTIGAVTGVQGISWIELTITGWSAHAGTTPMGLRRDPGVVAARINLFARELAELLGGGQVATCGVVSHTPNLVNVVPSKVTMTIDLRNIDDAVLQQAEAKVLSFASESAGAEGCTVESRSLARFEPVDFDTDVIDLVESTAQALGHSVRRLPSGAGHDAQMLARVCPTAMVFTPSVNGISHNVTEYTKPDDLQAGADVLLHTMLALATNRRAGATAHSSLDEVTS